MMLLLLLLFGMYDRFLLSSALPQGLELAQWLQAPAWADYSGEVENGVMVHQYGPHETGRLTLRYNPASDRLTVAGSLQSFRHGHNSGPFPFAQARETCEALAAALLLEPDALRVHVLETGVNVTLPSPPAALLAQVGRATYGPLLTPFYAVRPPAGASAPLLYTAHFNEYRVKVYDKGTYNRIRKKPASAGNSLRFEILYNKGRKAAKALGWDGNLTLANLMQPDVYTRLSEALLTSWHRVHLPVTAMPAELTTDERMLLFSGSADEGFWEHMKRTASPATYKRKRALFKRLQSKAAAGNALPYTAEIEAQIRAGLPD